MSHSFYVPDCPLVKKFHNRYRKDMQLTPEQKETLKTNFGISANKMMEKDVLPILRKKLKKHRFTEKHIIG